MFIPKPHQRGSRFSHSLITLLGLLLYLASPIGVPAQDDDVVRVRTDLVAIPLVVTDARGSRIAGLTVNDFVLTSDVGPAKIDYFASGTDRVALLFALDTSGSSRETIARQREAAVALYSRFGQGSRVAVLQFSNVARLKAPFTSNAEGAKGAFALEARPNAPTAIFDAAATAARAFDGGGGSSTERRIVILMSDGLDTHSSTRYQSVIEAARQRGVSFYVIHFPLFSPNEGRLQARPPSKGFRELAERTGGKYFRVGDARTALNPKAEVDLAPVFQTIEDDLRGQYVLGFYPGEAGRDSRFHKVTVIVATRNRKKLRVLQFVEGFNLR